MSDFKTVGLDTSELTPVDRVDSLYEKQREDVAAMRASLLSCSRTDPLSVQSALKNITVMRVFHQITRIIRYTEMMDKIEDKLYTAIDKSLENMNENSPSTWVQLLGIQEKLQKSMIESNKLLQPYLDPSLYETVITIETQNASEEDNLQKLLIDQESREKIRTSAQSVLAAISGLDNKDGVDNG